MLAVASPAPAEEQLRYETPDWIFTAPAALGTQADLELVGRSVQLCTDEVERLVGRRPARPAKFEYLWVVGRGGPATGGGPGGVTVWLPTADYRLVTDLVRPFYEDRIAHGTCFGPHEVTHVLSSESFYSARGELLVWWASEGLATFTDQLYQSASWRCCAQPLQVRFRCEEAGYVDGLERKAYSDLSPFTVSYDTYRTASCLWWAVYERGGLPAIRGILAGMRYRQPLTSGELLAHHVHRVLNADLRPVVARYGFEPAELEAGPVPSIPGCTLIGTAIADTIAGTSGPDTICGLDGNDGLTGGPGADILDGGRGNDTVNARDDGRDVVRGGPGRDAARIDVRLDRVTGVERILR